MISSVHRSPTTSRAAAKVQTWLYDRRSAIPVTLFPLTTCTDCSLLQNNEVNQRKRKFRSGRGGVVRPALRGGAAGGQPPCRPHRHPHEDPPPARGVPSSLAVGRGRRRGRG